MLTLVSSMSHASNNPNCVIKAMRQGQLAYGSTVYLHCKRMGEGPFGYYWINPNRHHVVCIDDALNCKPISPFKGITKLTIEKKYETNGD